MKQKKWPELDITGHLSTRAEKETRYIQYGQILFFLLTKTMVLQQRNINSNTSFINFKGNMIQNVSDYTLFGSLIKSNGNLNQSFEDLAKRAQKVLFSINSRVASLGIFQSKFQIIFLISWFNQC